MLPILANQLQRGPLGSKSHKCGNQRAPESLGSTGNQVAALVEVRMCQHLKRRQCPQRSSHTQLQFVRRHVFFPIHYFNSISLTVLGVPKYESSQHNYWQSQICHQCHGWGSWWSYVMERQKHHTRWFKKLLSKNLESQWTLSLSDLIASPLVLHQWPR